MIFPDADPVEWRNRYRLPELEDACARCRQTFPLNVPILMQGCAGLATPLHECGEDFRSVILTPESENAKAFWNQIVKCGGEGIVPSPG
jgi:hypothetical protein